MVIGGDSRSRGRGFESWHRILDGHFFSYLYCCKICNVWLKRPKIKDKRGTGWAIFEDNFRRSVVAQLAERSLLIPEV